jgi:hypothetical protein
MNDELTYHPQSLLCKGIAGMLFACLLMSIAVFHSIVEN